MVQKTDEIAVAGAGVELDSGSAAYVYYMRPPESEGQHLIGGDGGGSGGQCSSSDTLDSGTCSDIEVTPPPPLPKKMSQMLKSSKAAGAATALALVTINSHDSRQERSLVVETAAESIPDSQPAIDKDGADVGDRNGDDDDDDDGDDVDGTKQIDEDHIENINGNDGEQEQQQSSHTRHGHVNVTDSDGSESCLSCDSLNLDKLGLIVQSAEDNGGAVIHAINIQHAAFNASDPTAADGALSHLQDCCHADIKANCTGPELPIRKYRNLARSCSGLPDSLLAAIRGNRPRVYDEAKLAQLTVPAAPAAAYDKEDELINTTRSILMDKINSLHAGTQRDQLLPAANNPSTQHTINDFATDASTASNNQMRGSFFESDRYYKFHIHERSNAESNGADSDGVSQAGGSSSLEITPSVIDDDESFAGLKDLTSGTSTIRSNKGTVRGVKNRVRNGIATFLQMQQTTGMKNYKDREIGKVVVYSTSMGIVRETYTKCMSVKQILRTLLIKFEEKDIFMSNEYQQEIRDRMQTDCVTVPQVFVDGQHFGDAECIERLNENGELRKMLKPYKCLESPYTCKVCGGYRLLPCPSCGGSKKSIHRNHFTAEFVALKCMNCDEVGLVKCHNC
ncbi:glutaredoxin domain-containing cysteine-rich protein CG31559-like [Anopheles darlingi]|uniref:glutaredoxin domain-containing cysteine-rich protein CG31559-like n=1 Tax=Anopheles darlingi TaxID=43151 RepID=UPI0021005C27|nr:glutaredoxin domain-containing cysteine-rich protein CG31559-like [Anopheles darlingi]